MQYIIIIFPLILGCLFLLSPKRKGIRISLKIIKTLGIVVFALVLLRLFWFDIYKIPSESMEHTLIKGDYIIIRKNKLPQADDLAVFTGTSKKPQIMVKRCVGLPGDNLIIDRDTLYRNKKLVLESPNLQWTYYYNQGEISREEINDILNREVNSSNNLLLLTRAEAQCIRNGLGDSTLRSATHKEGRKGNVYPQDLPINRDNMIIAPIPYVGMDVDFQSNSFFWYKRVISYESNYAKFNENNELIVNGATYHKYSFKDDYYFMMGDNRHRSYDSRYYSYIPRSNILGVVCVSISPIRNYRIEMH